MQIFGDIDQILAKKWRFLLKPVIFTFSVQINGTYYKSKLPFLSQFFGGN
jgi:hypothetical protein